jgi:hypothetical protein
VSDRFDRVWEPRVGSTAAGLLRKRAWIVVGWAVAFVAAFVIISATASSMYNEIVLPLTFVWICVSFLLLRWFNRRIAAAMSSHLGVQISTWTIPSIRNAERFDREVEVLRGVRPVKERSFLGGFVRIRRPAP